jgi:hypothetical protein
MLAYGTRLGKGRVSGLLNEIIENGSRTDRDDADDNAGDKESSHVNSPSFTIRSRPADETRP